MSYFDNLTNSDITPKRRGYVGNATGILVNKVDV